MHFSSVVVGPLLTLIFPILTLVPGVVFSSEKTVIGAVEHVVLLPWGIRVPARIDTGAARTSLGARDLKISGVVADFKLRDAVGGHRLRLPILDWRIYKTGEGVDRRPIVEFELCIGRKKLRTRANLNERGHLKYPMLIGRWLLTEGNFLVDVTRRMTAKPDCGATNEKQKTNSPVLTPDKR